MRYESSDRREKREVERGEVASSRQVLEEVLSSVTDVLGMDVAFVSELVEDRLVFRALKGDAASFGWEESEPLPLEETYCHQYGSPFEGVLLEARSNRRYNSKAAKQVASGYK